MASGPEHYREAEKLAEAAEHHANVLKDWTASVGCATLAQVHATLALAAATALAPHKMVTSDPDYKAWTFAADTPGRRR